MSTPTMAAADDDWADGDHADFGSQDTGSGDPCPWCDGTGRSDGAKCSECSGTGIEAVDGADAGSGDANEEAMWKFASENQLSDAEEEKDDRSSAGRYIRLQAEELDRRRRRLAEDLREQLSLDWDEVDCMLRAGNWNIDAITNEWINNPGGAREKLGVGPPSERKQDSAAAGPAPGEAERKVRCLNPMCDNDDELLSTDEARALGCGHWFCNDCWRMHLTAQVKAGPSSVFAPCMGLSCKKKGCGHNKAEENCRCQLLVPERWFHELLPGDSGPLAEARKKWLGWLRERFVEASKDLQFCPSPGCNHVIADVEGHGLPAECDCGHQFCFKCRLDDHLPVPCDLAKRFIELDTTDTLTMVLIATTTKQCPKCKAPTERNLACIHMTCSRCKHQYCWICTKDWRGHQGGYYSCTEYNEQQQKGQLSAEQQELIDNRELLSKYQVHRSKHDAARRHIKQLTALRQSVDQDETLFETKKFLYRAIDQLRAGFRLIQWSHCLTYFVKAGPEKRLFEFQQESLIQLCTKLCELLCSMTVNEMCESRSRARIGNEASLVESQRLKTIDSLEQGQLIESIQNEADKHADSWACGHCKRVHSNHLGLKSCPHCKACKLHCDQACFACFPRNIF